MRKSLSDLLKRLLLTFTLPLLLFQTAQAQNQNIVEIAQADENFSILVDAVIKADLVDALSGENELTVFAPTNDAFVALLEATEGVNSLDDLTEEQVEEILLYHVLAGTTLAGDLSDGLIAETLNGEDVKFTLGGDFPQINSSNIVSTDILASNGVIHVIDAVLTPPQNIVEIASANEDFSILVDAVVKAGLVEALSEEDDDDDEDDELTVFAPTNAAFEALLGSATLDDIPEEDLIDILLYHVLEGKTYASELSDGLTVETLNEDEVTFTINETEVKINMSNIVVTDIIASNGVIHVIDAVLTPPQNIVEIASSNPDFSLLVDAVVKADLVEALSEEDDDDKLTVFAPTNAAFEALLGGATLEDISKDELTDILLYHVLEGVTLAGDLSDGLTVETLNGDEVTFTVTETEVKINESNIIDTDIIASNGVIHVIDAVLTPPQNIVEIASSNPDFSTLVDAVVKADLVDALSEDDDEDKLTVFAPTNAAFEALLGEATLEDVSVEDLTNILLYHVLEGTTLASDLSDGLIATTLNGEDVKFTLGGEFPQINESNIIVTDIVASNGVIHVIDAVLTPPQNIVEIASANPDFSLLVDAVVKADLVHALADEDDELTVFAPTNAAFEALLGETTLEDVPVEDLTEILLYHVLKGKTYAGDLSDGLTVETLNGEEVTFTITETEVKINESNIIATDIIASNGVIHVIDAVLTPPQNIVEIASANPDFSLLVDAVVKADLVHALADEDEEYTVFAPTNAAFEALLGEATLEDVAVEDLTDILLYHVLEGTTLAGDLSDGLIVETLNGEDVKFTFADGKVFINGAEIVMTDIIASNGVIHVIDAVLTPPQNIVEIASADENFSTLVSAVVKADLVHALADEDEELTVFAPTNAAFEALLGEATLDDVPVEELTEILLYHVLAGTNYAADLSDGLMVETLNGENVQFTINETELKINESNIVVTDIIASNGVIHVIDVVLTPPQNIVEIASGNPDFSILVDAVVKAGLVDALSDDDDELTVFAPTNDAFVALLEATEGVSSLDDLTVEQITNILLYHVLEGVTLEADLSDGLIAETLNGEDVKFTIDESGAKVNESNIVATDIMASNGVIHVIDAVLTPPQNIVEIASANPDFSILVDAVVKAGLVDALSSDDELTVFAPTNDAFVALLEATEGVSSLDDLTVEQITDILLYHVLGGKTYAGDLSDGLIATTLNGEDVKFTINEMGAKINESNIVMTDIIASNGVIHVIDAVLTPPQNIVEIASANPDFSILVDAVVKAGLVDALSADNELTVFAPTNDAFVALLEATEGVNSLDDLTVEQITDILLYHVLGGKVYSNQLSDGQKAETLNGKFVEFTVNEEGIKVNDSNIAPADILASNGVIHVIDAVLLPPAIEVMSFTLVDAETNEDIMELTEGMEIDLAEITATSFNIRANVSPSKVGSVAFEFNGNKGRTENVVPYALFGDIAGNYFGRRLTTGDYTVTATPFEQTLGRGEAGNSLTVNFKVVSNAGVTGFTLVDAITNEDITPIIDGDVIHLTTLINIRADLNVPAEDVVFVRFSLNDRETFRIERVFPYALYGDIGGNYFEGKPEPGIYTITATPQLKGGQEATPLTITIEIVDKTVGNSNNNGNDDERNAAENTLLQDVSVFPNPAVEQLNLAFKSFRNENVKVRILDLTGRVFIQEEMKARGQMNRLQLNVGQLQRGIYLLSIESSTFGSELFRFVKD